MNQGRKQFAPETAVGTGAAEPLVDEYEAAKEVPSIDESVLEGKHSTNQPASAPTIEYSGEPTAEPTTGDDEKSTGEDPEVRSGENEGVVEGGDPDVNKPAEEVRPEVPQETKRKRAAVKKDS